MLSKKQRIPRKLFEEVFTNAKVFHSRLFTLRVSRRVSHTKELSSPRFAFVVSSKVAKKATERNLLRRRGYSAVREIVSSMRPGAHMFFMKKEAKDTNFTELVKEIHDTLKNIGKLL